MRILLVEDDPLLGEAVRQGLLQEGFTVDWVRDGQEADGALATDEFSLLILDLGLPRLDGMTLLRRLRARGRALPVLILTARDTILDKVTGLDAGADDFLVKPVDLDELAARARALLRRASGRAQPAICHGELCLEPLARRVTVGGQPVELSAREFAILQTLLENAGRVLTRPQIEQSLYGWGEGVESNAVEVHIHHLRRKLGNGFIRTLRGVGYVVERPAEQPEASVSTQTP
ncbi:MAG: response regulator [Betaproteobacteria bacterium]|nr:response regulator [Betaproteobacteria bacterium]